jgi:hypothetical protein
VLADTGYDSNDLGEAIEYDAAGRPTGRRLVVPQRRRHNRYGGRTRSWRETYRRRTRRRHREARRRSYEGRFGRRLDKRRGRTVEPFFGRFKEQFELVDHVRHRGLGNTRTQLLAALLLYQLLLVYNRLKGREDAEVKWILDLL